MPKSRLTLAVLVAAVTLLVTPKAFAATIPISAAAFGPGSTLSTFTGLADGTEVNGLTVDGILYQYSAGNGQVVINGGPGVTNTIAPPNIVSTGTPSGILTLTLPSLVDMFGYGYALLATAPVMNATTIALFNGASPVGTLSYNGLPDPVFTGGFAGIQSTLPFNRVQLTFNSASAPAFAVDNVRTGIVNSSTVPEPASLLLLGTGLLAIARARTRRK